jgi:hypothetical protein
MDPQTHRSQPKRRHFGALTGLVGEISSAEMSHRMYRACRDAFPEQNPDWRQPYNHVEAWTDVRIAFEFLRRNPAYWEFVEQVYSLGESDSPDETYRQIKQRLADEFGLWEVVDPRLPMEVNRILWTPSASLSSRYAYALARGDSYAETEYRFGRHSPPDTITIDLRADAPVDAQVDFVRWLLNRVRRAMGLDHRNVPRFQRRLFPDYLRLLDARNDGASLATIAEHLCPGEDSIIAVDLIRKRLSMAEAMRDGGYRLLLLWSNKIELPARYEEMPDKLDRLAWELSELAETPDSSDEFQEVWVKFQQEWDRQGAITDEVARNRPRRPRRR